MSFELSDILQLVVGVSIMYIWILRTTKTTAFRVGDATTLQQEFTEAGFPDWLYDIMRIVKPIFAFLLVIGITYKPFFLPCMIFTTAFMIGAVYAHVKVKDSLFKMIPAVTLLMFCFIIFSCPSKW